jgi:hypothetical protein
MSDFDSYLNFWTHGVQTVVENPERTRRVQHSGWGTLVEQHYSESEGWFHLPLHSPTQVIAVTSSPVNRQLSLRTALLGAVRLKARLNQYASIVELHLRAGEQLVRTKAVSIAGPQEVDEWFDVRTVDARGRLLYLVDQVPLVLCVRVEFSGTEPSGQVIFFGAGAYYLNLI